MKNISATRKCPQQVDKKPHVTCQPMYYHTEWTMVDPFEKELDLQNYLAKDMSRHEIHTSGPWGDKGWAVTN